MLNQTKVTIKKGTAATTILVDEKNSTAVSIVIGDTGVTANASGEKLVKAGTPVKGDLKNRNTPFTVAADGTGAVGVILHDVYVTDGKANSQAVIFGIVDISKVESDVATMLTAAEANLKMIQVIK